MGGVPGYCVWDEGKKILFRCSVFCYETVPGSSLSKSRLLMLYRDNHTSVSKNGVSIQFYSLKASFASFLSPPSYQIGDRNEAKEAFRDTRVELN